MLFNDLQINVLLPNASSPIISSQRKSMPFFPFWQVDEIGAVFLFERSGATNLRFNIPHQS